MSDNIDFTAGTDPLENALTQSGALPETAVDNTPVYKVMADSKIPVSKHRGKLWKSRKTAGRKAMKDIADAWDEAIKYYNHDQSSHREGNSPDVSGNRSNARRLNERHSATENVVFSNVNAQIPELYAKNPIIELTSQAASDDAKLESDHKFIAQVEKLVNILFSMKQSPGVNLKPKAKRNVLVTLLTNRSWFEVGYVKKDVSSETALMQLRELSTELEKATSVSEIEEAEGKIRAIEEKIEFLQPSGPYVRVRLPHQVLVDPNTTSPDGSDATWMMVEDMLPTQYIKAVYMKETNEDSEEYQSIFEPTHILDGTPSEGEDNNYSIFNSGAGYMQHGFESQDSFDKSKYTRVWYVWDKITRRLEMYNDKNWNWPIWVWDDPYQLDQFFPFVPLSFHDNPIGMYAKGEVSYYLDQQDMLNEINDEQRRALLWVRRNLFYDKNSMSQATADAILSGNTNQATPLDVKEGMEPAKMVFSIPPPSMAYQQTFDKRGIYSAIDRIAATNDVARGGEFKTNTTNQAVEYYSTQGNKRSDLRLDSIEDAIAGVGWMLAQLCLRFMEPETVSKYINEPVEPGWGPTDPLNPSVVISARCVGGSTTKSSASAKKQEAVQVGQVLSQYVKAAPGAVLGVTLRMMGEAFDDVNIRAEDWKKIEDEVAQTITNGQGGAPGQQGGPPQPGAPQGPGASRDPREQAIMVTQALSSLPPKMLQAIGTALAQGVAPEQILEHILSQTNAGAPQQ